MQSKRVSIIGTVGVPACYGGFETLVENLITDAEVDITVYCSSKNYSKKVDYYKDAKLVYIPLRANGIQSVIYDIASLIHSLFFRSDVVLILGVSGCIFLPLFKLFSNTKVITNIDGIEWRRDKWKGLAKKFLKSSERMAIKYSDEIIADNQAISIYVKDEYGINCHVIAYGGDHAVTSGLSSVAEYNLPDEYSFSVCRIEPENNVHMTLEAFSKLPEYSFVLVGNWDNSEYGTSLRLKYNDHQHLYLLDPIYDLRQLATLRREAKFYLHGHSAGGTNPSLVEAMHFGRPVIAFDCSFNRYTTENKALYFKTSDQLLSLIKNTGVEKAEAVGKNMKEIAQTHYTWDIIAQQYYTLLKS